jgi:hypothetical protein
LGVIYMTNPISEGAVQASDRPVVTPAMIEAGAERLAEIAPDCLNYRQGVIEILRAAGFALFPSA